MPTDEQIIEALRPVEDPELRRSIVDLGMVRGVSNDGGRVAIQFALTVAGCPLRNEIQKRVSDALLMMPDVTGVSLDFTVMTDQEREAVRSMLHGDAGSTAGPGHAHGHAEGRKVPISEAGSKTRPLLIASGKGGVGKSTVTVNLAVALASQGYSVGVVDADIYGYSIPRMLGTDRDPVAIDTMLVPPEAHGVRCISMGYFVLPRRCLLGRARLLAHRHSARYRRHRAVAQPVPAAWRGVRRHHAAACCAEGRSFVGGHGRQGALAGEGHHREHVVVHGRRRQAVRDLRQRGGQELADELGIAPLGKLPLVPALREGGDDGRPITAVDPTSEAAQTFREIARRIAVELKPRKIFSPGLTIS